MVSEVAETKAEARDRLESLLSIDPFDLRARRKLGILDGKIQPDTNFNPDAVQIPATQVQQQTEGRRFSCPKCGGRLTYSADGSSLVCEFCNTQQTLSGKTVRAEAEHANDFLSAMISGRGHWQPQAELALHCAGCGAVFIVPPAHLSMNCPYCDSPHATHQPAEELILPNQVVPFEIGEVAAKEAMRAWLANHFRTEWPKLARGVELFLPAWIFHVVGILPWSCEVRRNREWVTEKGDQIVDLDNILLAGTQRLGDLWGKALPGYDLTKAQPFKEGYLADRAAETYQIELGDASLDARQITRDRMRQRVDDRIMEQHRNLSVNSTNLMIESFRLILLPAWLTHYQNAKGGRVDLLMNGQNGAVVT